MTSYRFRLVVWLVTAGASAVWCMLTASIDGVAAAARPATQASSAPASGSGRSVGDGVYSTDQARRGEKIFNTVCITCHETRMWRPDWEQKSLGDVFEVIRDYMPEDNPGSLSPPDVRDVLAYILRANDVPPGAADMPEELAELREIRMTVE